jgi:hypothetical protein
MIEKRNPVWGRELVHVHFVCFCPKKFNSPSAASRQTFTDSTDTGTDESFVRTSKLFTSIIPVIFHLSHRLAYRPQKLTFDAYS